MGRKILIGALAVLLIGVLGSNGWGARHALLMGAWEYPNLGRPLQGPPYDVEVLEELLKKEYRFDSVKTLKDDQMTRKRMLDALEQLDQKTAPGDFILIYFSGHGTSAYDKYNKWGLDSFTGALLPNDFKNSGTITELMAQAVIGTRDIRPILTRLEKNDRQILALFDACYSGFAVRSFGAPPPTRYVPLPLDDLTEEERPGAYGSDTIHAPPYPYRNVIYISASSCQEEAFDFNYQMMLQKGKKTVDQKPHGAMTDSLIRALKGEADTDKDGKITYNELYRYVRYNTSLNFRQTPQLLYAESRAGILDQPVFQTRSAPQPPDPSPAPVNGPLRVKLQNISPGFRKSVEAIPGIETVKEGEYDILATAQPLEKRAVQRSLNLYLPNETLLAQGSEGEMVEHLRRHVHVKKLIRHTYPDQSFNVSVDLIGDKGVLVKGETIGFTVKADEDAYILLINIEPGGAINVLYPYTKEELSPVRAGQPLSLADMCVVDGKSYGTEHIKVIGFKNRPPALEKLMGQNGFTPDAELYSSLMALVQNPGSPASQMTIQIKTAASSDITWIENE